MIEKVLKVIESCKTLDQLKIAENYVELYNQDEENINNIIEANDKLIDKHQQILKS